MENKLNEEEGKQLQEPGCRSLGLGYSALMGERLLAVRNSLLSEIR